MQFYLARYFHPLPKRFCSFSKQITTQILVVLCVCQLIPKGCAQEVTKVDDSPHGVVLMKLADFAYPPLARTARITGDVVIQLMIKKDGSIESAMAISGHPMLTQSALDNAKQSKFECRGCEKEFTDYTLTYTYDLADPATTPPDPCCCSHSAPTLLSGPSVVQSANHITIHGGLMCICPDECTSREAERESHYHSLKCLYLWKCGNHHYGVY